MKFRTIIVSSLPSVILLSGLIFLAYSPLTVSKLVTLQNDIVVVFTKGLSNDLSYALTNTFSYLWSNVLSIITVFLLIVCLGFVVNLFFLKEIDFRILITSNIILVGLAYVLTNFSIFMLLTAVGLFIGPVKVYKTFEEKKNNFSTGYHFISSQLRTMNLFLTIGVFLVIFLDMSSYEAKINESNMELISSLIPNVTMMQESQKMLVTQISEGFQSSVDEEYQAMSSREKTECKSMRDNLIHGLKDYEEEYGRQIEEQGLTLDQSQFIEVFPAFNIIAKTSPIFTAFTVYIILTFLTPLASVFSGFVYSGVKKMKKTKA